MRRRHLLGMAAAATAAAALPLSPARAAETSPKVLVIGVDGFVADRVRDANAPTLAKLQDTALDARSLLYTQPMAPTSSGPGWSTILTGVWPDKHKVVDNSFGGNDLKSYPDWLSTAKSARPEIQTWAAADWKPIGDYLFGDGIDATIVLDGDKDGYVEHDATIADETEAHLAKDAADATFVYFGQLDIVGHADGSGSQNYLDEIAVVDGFVSRLLAAVESRPTRAEENWLIMLTTDHGHLDSGGHGGDSLIERGTFILATGDGISAAKPVTTRLVDVAASALIHLGATPSDTMDGRAVTHEDSDPFQTVKLRPAVTEDIDAEILGWSPELPQGWSRDNAKLPEGGVTEWAGWSLVSDAFWSSAQRGQNRETFVRGRGTFAVADSDEWADTDAASGKTFDSTLWTPSVAANAKVTVRLTHLYRQEGEQRGEILASWDDGEPQVVRTLSADVNGPDAIDVDRPSGAREVRIGFRLTGVNNWYWAVDDVRVE